MTTHRRTLVTGLILIATLAGCATAAGPSASPAVPGSTARPGPTDVPGGPSAAPGGSVIGGGGLVDPVPGQPQFVVPRPGALDPHPVGIETLRATVDAGRVTVVATWWSGVEPCYVLDSVNVKQDGNEFTIALVEGRGPGDMVCIEIAVEKATSIDLGALAPGEYTVRAQEGTAAPVTFTVG